MRQSRPLARMLALAVPAAAAAALSAQPALAAPEPVDNLSHVPNRTAISFHHSWTNTHVGTANEREARPGLSIVKLYLADYALRHGDGSAEDRQLAERMIRSSDNSAADRLGAKYPHGINATAAEYGLASTSSPGYWGQARTSTADVVSFLERKRATDPSSPILSWMAGHAPVMTEGIPQDYGTELLPGVIGTKWGVSDHGLPVASSASFGTDFTIAAITYGTRDQHTDDVLGAFRPGPPPLPPIDPQIEQVLRTVLAAPGAPSAAPQLPPLPPPLQLPTGS
jgi:hypothetical protein